MTMMRRPWVVGVEVAGEGRGREGMGGAVLEMPLEWEGTPGWRHAVMTVIEGMIVQL